MGFDIPIYQKNCVFYEKNVEEKVRTIEKRVFFI